MWKGSSYLGNLPGTVNAAANAKGDSFKIDFKCMITRQLIFESVVLLPTARVVRVSTFAVSETYPYVSSTNVRSTGVFLHGWRSHLQLCDLVLWYSSGFLLRWYFWEGSAYLLRQVCVPWIPNYNTHGLLIGASPLILWGPFHTWQFVWDGDNTSGVSVPLTRTSCC